MNHYGDLIVCDECLRTPCLRGCPNEPEPAVKTYICSNCGDEITDGYKINDEILCEDCVESYRFTAELEE